MDLHGSHYYQGSTTCTLHQTRTDPMEELPRNLLAMRISGMSRWWQELECLRSLQHTSSLVSPWYAKSGAGRVSRCHAVHAITSSHFCQPSMQSFPCHLPYPRHRITLTTTALVPVRSFQLLTWACPRSACPSPRQSTDLRFSSSLFTFHALWRGRGKVVPVRRIREVKELDSLV